MPATLIHTWIATNTFTYRLAVLLGTDKSCTYVVERQTKDIMGDVAWAQEFSCNQQQGDQKLLLLIGAVASLVLQDDVKAAAFKLAGWEGVGPLTRPAISTSDVAKSLTHEGRKHLEELLEKFKTVQGVATGAPPNTGEGGIVGIDAGGGSNGVWTGTKTVITGGTGGGGRGTL